MKLEAPRSVGHGALPGFEIFVPAPGVEQHHGFARADSPTRDQLPECGEPGAALGRSENSFESGHLHWVTFGQRSVDEMAHANEVVVDITQEDYERIAAERKKASATTQQQ